MSAMAKRRDEMPKERSVRMSFRMTMSMRQYVRERAKARRMTDGQVICDLIGDAMEFSGIVDAIFKATIRDKFKAL